MTQFTMGDLSGFAAEIEKEDYDCNAIDFANGESEIQKINEEYKKIIIRYKSSDVKTIIIDCKSNKITAVSFNGTLRICPRELFEAFKKYREYYSSRDDLYFYFFNEDKGIGKYILSFFEDSHQRVDVHENDEYLSNLTLSWA